MRALFDSLRSSLWFLPSLAVAACTGMAVGLIELQGWLPADALTRFPRLFGAAADGTRGMLEAIATATITVAGVVFSMTLVALSLASSQYSPRVLRNFMRDRANQLVLGVLLGVYAYCIVVLRTIRAGDDGFVPSLAALGAIALAFVSIAALIHFIHHISVSIQAAHILASIHTETAQTIERMYPQRLDEGDEASAAAAPPPSGPWAPVGAPVSGYLQGVDMNALLRVARDDEAVIRVDVRVGDFVAAGAPLALVAPVAKAHAIGPRLLRAVAIGEQRTVQEDVAFGLRQLVDVALKALSPGINDPTTAVMCIDRLGALLRELAGRDIASPHRCDDGVLRVITPAPTFATLLDLGVEEIHRAARAHPVVLARLIAMLADVGGATSSPTRRSAVLQALRRIEPTVRNIDEPAAREEIGRSIAAARRALGGAI